MTATTAIHVSQPARYRIRFQGRLQVDWSDWLKEACEEVESAEAPAPVRTTLTGTVADQAALFGLLARLRDRGMPLLLVEYLPPAVEAGPAAAKEETHEH